MTPLTLADFSIGDIVMFGRDNGEKTRGEVVRKGRSKLKVKQLDTRGLQRSYPIGTVWTVPPDFCEKVTGTVNIPATSQTVTEFAPRNVKPAPRGADLPTFTRVAKANGFDASLLGQCINLDGSRLTIVGSKPRAPKYPFIGEGVRGGRYKLTAAQVRSGLPASQRPAPKAKRSDADIMEEILDVYCDLSPENLTCDGEASFTHVSRTRSRLNRRLRELEGELGRKVSETAAYNWLDATTKPTTAVS